MIESWGRALAGVFGRARFPWREDPVLGWVAYPEETARLMAWPCVDGCWRWTVEVEAHGVWWSVASARFARAELQGLAESTRRERAQVAAERAWVEWSRALVTPGGVR